MPTPKPHPKMMVIGDSLAQGCRSLTVTGSLCSQSWAARIAAQQNWPFITPNHPRAVLFDLEREIRQLNPVDAAPSQLTLGGFVGRYLQNLKNWEQDSPSSVECFDNLALAGAAVGDLYSRTAKSSDQQIKDVLMGDLLKALQISKIGSLHLAINGRFVLNPSRNPECAEFSQLDWVEKRLPERLFVQIGHNHGLFGVGFSAMISDVQNPEAAITQTGGEFGSYWSQWQKVAERLAQLPDQVRSIVVILLPKVGAVGNLVPSSDERKNGYAPAYEPAFSTRSRLPGSHLAMIDQAIQEVNRKIHELLIGAAKTTGREKRLATISGYDLLEKVDYKNTKQVSRRIRVTRDVTADNRYLDGSLRFGWPPVAHYELTKGGFFSVDGMHPSGLGYGELASKVMNALGMQHNRAALLEQTYTEDRLLSDYPPELDMVVGLLAVIRRAVNVAHFDHTPVGDLSETMHFADVLRVLKTVFIRR